MRATAVAVEETQRPGTPEELRGTVAPDQPVLLAGSTERWRSSGILAWLEANGWSWTVAEDAERASWLASIQKVSLVLVAGDEAFVWSTIDATRPVTMAPMVVLASPSSRGVVSFVEAGVDALMDPQSGAEEVFARVVALLRRSDHGWGPGTRFLRADGLVVDLWARECDLDGVRLHLSPTEYSLLTFLMGHPEQAIPSQVIVRRVWGWLPSDGKNTLRIFVNRLRRKLGDDHRAPRYIASVRGTGYRFVHSVAEIGDQAEPLLERTDVAPLLELLEQLAVGLRGCDDVACAGELLLDSLEVSGYADAMALFRLEGARPDEARLRLVHGRHLPDEWFASVADGVPLQPSFASAQSVLTLEPVQLGDIGQMADHFSATASRLEGTGYRACLFLPIECGDGVWGHLGLVRRARQPFDVVGTSYLRAACAVFALAVDDMDRKRTAS
jgi:DNA-binding response OmpR family regulator